MSFTDLIPGVPQLKLIAIAGGVLVAGATGAFIDHKFMTGAVANAHLETANLQATYTAYKGAVAASAAKATAVALDQQTALQGRVDALQTQLLASQKEADARSKSLNAILANAKPGDVRPIGAAALAYYDRLRGP